jgi:hypothetical protein
LRGRDSQLLLQLAGEVILFDYWTNGRVLAWFPLFLGRRHTVTADVVIKVGVQDVRSLWSDAQIGNVLLTRRGRGLRHRVSLRDELESASWRPPGFGLIRVIIRALLTSLQKLLVKLYFNIFVIDDNSNGIRVLVAIF